METALGIRPAVVYKISREELHLKEIFFQRMSHRLCKQQKVEYVGISNDFLKLFRD